VGNGFDPLRQCRSEEDLRAMAVHLLYKSHEREPDPFTKRAVKMLTAIFSAGLLEGYPLLTIRRSHASYWPGASR
jgi:hypothetical protein